MLFLIGSTIYLGHAPVYGLTPDPINTYPIWLYTINNIGLLLLLLLLYFSPILLIVVSVLKWASVKNHIIFWYLLYLFGIAFFILLRTTTCFKWLLD